MRQITKHRTTIRISAVILGMVFAVSATPPESSLKRFHDTDNSVTRMQILREVGTSKDEKVKAGDSTAAEASLTSEEKTLLLEALEDTRATVAEASIRRIGELKVAEFEQQLISLFSEAKKRFPAGYVERVKVSIISAVGQSKGPQAVPFLDKLLRYDSGKQYYETVLLAAQETGNPALLSAVQEFKSNRELELQQMIDAGANPIATSKLKMVIKLAQDVASDLSDRNGEQ